MTRDKHAVVEWIGGIAPLPATVTGEGEPYRPEGLFWMDADGLIQGSAVDKAGMLLQQAGSSLREAMCKPLCGGAPPTHVRVASAELAAVLRDAHPRLDIVCAPTPELEEMLALMRTTLGSEIEVTPTYLPQGTEPAAVASLFTAAAELFRTQPWNIVPDDQCLIEVDIEALQLHNAVICVIGQLGESFGFLMFPGVAQFNAYCEAARAARRQAPPVVGPDSNWPPFLALNFERGADLDPALRKEISAHGWKVAGRSAYPCPVAVDTQLMHRPLTVRELCIIEATSRALARMAQEASILRAAWQGAQRISRTSSVPTHGGDVEVTLRTLERHREIDDPILGLIALESASDELDAEERAPLEIALMDEFAASPEGAVFNQLDTCGLVMDLAADYLGVTIAGLDADGLDEVLFEIMPRKVSIDPSEAPAIVEELRAFYEFLKRTRDFSEADDCLDVLGGDAAGELHGALSDRTRFGMAKSLVMAGQQAGFDMHTQEGIDAWMRATQGKPLPASAQLPFAGFSLPASAKGTKAKKKSKRKAVRAARKKNR